MRLSSSSWRRYGLLLWGIPPVNAKIVRCALQAELVCGVNRAEVKLFTFGLIQMGIDPLPSLFDYASPQ